MRNDVPTVEAVAARTLQVRSEAYADEVRRLVDAAYAPLFTRLALADPVRSHAAWSRMPRVRAWSDQLRELPVVRKSVKPTFETDYVEYSRRNGSWLFA